MKFWTNSAKFFVLIISFFMLFTSSSANAFAPATSSQWTLVQGHAVKGNSIGKALKYRGSLAKGKSEFVNKCAAVCKRQKGCGGFVVTFSDKAKTQPTRCVLKKVGSKPHASKASKDFYVKKDTFIKR
jgi:hypothetical protein